MTHSVWLRKTQLIALTGIALVFALPGQALAEEPANEAAAVTDQSPAAELALWNEIKESANPDDYLNYLNRFPNGMFFDPAKTRYEEMTGRAYVPTPEAVPSQNLEIPKAAEPVRTDAVQPELKPKKVQATKKQQARHKKVVAKKTKKVAVKTKKRLANASIKPKLRKKASAPTRRALAKVSKPKKAKSVSKRRICSAIAPGPGCPTIIRSTPIIPTRSGGGNGGGGGGSGGGGGGWGG